MSFIKRWISCIRLRPAGSISGPGLIAASVIVAIALLSLGAAMLADMRRTDSQQALQASTNVVATLEADIARNIELYDLSLRAVVDNLNDPEVKQVSPKLRQLILFDRAATAKYLGTVLVIDEAGHVVANSQDLKPRWYDYSTRDYFRAHRDDPNIGLYIGRPFVAPSSGKYIIGISRRLSHADGSFAGVVAGTLRLDYFHDLFSRVSMGPAAGMGIYRMDGTLITRLPFRERDIGLNIGNADVFKQAVNQPAGHLEVTAATDGIKRLYSYRRVGTLPLLVSAGMSLDAVYASWWREAITVSTMGLLLAAATIALAVFAANELRRRANAERQLAVLANTDGLTGLYNRRGFDEALQCEWIEAVHRGSRLALLMIDADHFKNYNDQYGHQAGDRALAAIGRCAAESVAAITGVAARYGGEEFAVLLPAASIHDAFRAAESIRKSVASLCSSSEESYPTVSIGIASHAPKAGELPDGLIACADRALYDAKRKGRNRTASEQVAFIEPGRKQVA